MNREEFLKQLVLLYPTSFNENNLQIWMSGYKDVLGEHIDYDKLLTSMMSENQYNTAPKPAWLKERATYKRIKGEEQIFEKLTYEVNSSEYEFHYEPKKQSIWEAREFLEKKFKKAGHKFKFIEPVPTTDIF